MGHRKKRDIRVTTHCCLVARAFFADEIILSGESDPAILKTIKSASKNWGGKLNLGYEPNWRQFLKKRKRKKELVVHLTMYGRILGENIDEIRRHSKAHRIVVVIGAEKMPPEIYKLADFNIAITNQPHSEVAALAIFLNELQKAAPLSKNAQEHFKNAKYVIKPGAKGN